MRLILLVLIPIALSNCTLQSPPNFYTSHRTAVYTKQIPDITLELMEESLSYYVECYSRSGLVSRDTILRALSTTVIRWEPEPFDCWYMVENNEWKKGKCAGVESSGFIRVVWFGSIEESELYHELTHWIMEYTIHRVDYTHRLKEWWDNLQQCSQEKP